MPSTLPVVVCVTSVTARARPKSATLATEPSEGSSTFSGLMSRWTRPARWAAPSGRNSWATSPRASLTDSGPAAMRSRNVGPSTYSITR